MRQKDIKADKSKTVFLAAGGTGGHVFPAEALGKALSARGWDIHMLTDKRARRFIAAGAAEASESGGFAADKVHIIASSTIASKNPLRLARSFAALLQGFWQAMRLCRRFRPNIVVGFGGYPTLPPLLAAYSLGIPIVIHEQNAVMGRANRLLARKAQKIACGFPPAKIDEHLVDKIVVTGNPLRPAVVEACSVPYHPPVLGEKLHLLIFGGSQGASFFAEIMPQALALLPQKMRDRLHITQQTRPVDEKELRAAYAKLGMKAEIAVFFKNLPSLMAKAHFIISRAGASTVAEIAAVGRPALLVPYPNALDHDQKYNALGLAESGGAEVWEQTQITPQKLADLLTEILDNPHILQKKARKLVAGCKKNATEELLALVEKYATI